MRDAARIGSLMRLTSGAAVVLVLGLASCAPPPPLEVVLALDGSWSSGLSAVEPHRLTFGETDDPTFVGEGFYYGETSKRSGIPFAWSRGPASEVFFHLGWQRDLQIDVCGHPFHWPGAPAQSISFELNGNPVAEIADLKPGYACSSVTLPGSSQVVGRNRLVASYGRVDRPSAVSNESSDTRDLAFAWSEIVFHGVDPSQMESTGGMVVMPAGAVTDHFVDLAPGSVLRIDACESVGEAVNLVSLSILDEEDEQETVHSFSCAKEPIEVGLRGHHGLTRVRFSSRPTSITETPTGIRLRSPVILSPSQPRPPVAETPRSEQARSLERRPNIIIYLVDALRADRLGVYGCDRPLSPNLDAMAADGITFTDVTAQSSWTKAAVASIFTGYWPRAHGVNGPDDRLPDHLRTIPEILQAEGYQTGAVVANAYVGEPFGFARGFDSFEFIEHSRGRSDVIHGRLEEWFRSRGDSPSPFFLYVHTIDPHAPYAPPEPFRESFAGTVADPSVGQVETVRGLVLGTVEPTEGLGDDLRLLYDAEVAANDASFGRLLDLLRENHELENTLVIFTSDHGEAFGEHGNWTHGLDLHHEVLAIPLVMRLPGGTQSNQRITTPVQHIDLLPTILETCGIQAGEAFPGVSLLAGDRPATIDRDRPVLSYLDYWGRSGASVIRDGWKLIRPLSAEFGPRVELYHRDSDQRETTDVSAVSPVRRGWLEAVLAESLTTRASGITTEVDPEIKEQLEALGYVN